MTKYAISIVGWDDYQERGDRANYIWFKFHSKTYTGDFWTRSSHVEKVVWLFLLCLRNRQQDPVVFVPDVLLVAYCSVKASEISSILNKLAELGVIQDESRKDPGSFQAISWPRLEESRVEGELPGETPAPLTPLWLARKWNELCGSLKKLREPVKLNPVRSSSASKRLKEHPNCDDWIAAIQRISLSTKCLGKENEPGKYENWAADFDWFIKPGRLDQILEGKWDGRKKAAPTLSPAAREALKGGAA